MRNDRNTCLVATNSHKRRVCPIDARYRPRSEHNRVRSTQLLQLELPLRVQHRLAQGHTRDVTSRHARQPIAGLQACDDVDITRCFCKDTAYNTAYDVIKMQDVFETGVFYVTFLSTIPFIVWQRKVPGETRSIESLSLLATVSVF